uniref:Uncharacterized protein n=1 Tax=Arundo donax TaxID=35708 RepID=A0A0A8ZCF2_ARUDO
MIWVVKFTNRQCSSSTNCRYTSPSFIDKNFQTGKD